MPGKIFIFSGNTAVESFVKKAIGWPESDIEVHQASEYYSTLEAFTAGIKNPKNYQLAIFDSSHTGSVCAEDLRDVFAGQTKKALVINLKLELEKEKIIEALKECFPKLLIKNIDVKVIVEKKIPTPPPAKAEPLPTLLLSASAAKYVAPPSPAATLKTVAPRTPAGSAAPRPTR